MNTTTNDLSYICAKIDTLSKQCDNMTADKIKERLDGISKDLKEVSFNIARRSKNVWNLTGVSEAEYNDWYWNVFVPSNIFNGEKPLSDEMKNDVLKG